ncbi:MAG: hypothetical protein HYZ23_03575 [Chloroflexi bacterium]|nr:hypothetical protein [Chloroflexota bacterium]
MRRFFILLVFISILPAACGQNPAPLPTPTMIPTPYPNALYIDPSTSLGEISPLIYGSNHGPWIAHSVDGLQPAYESGVTILRFPAGSWGDHNNVKSYQIDQFMSLIEKI